MDQIQRRYRDLAADCHNYWQKWQELNNEAISIARSLANDRIVLLDSKSSSESDPDFDPDRIHARISDYCTNKIPKLLEKFEITMKKFKKMDANIDLLIKLSNDQSIVCKSDRLSNNQSIDCKLDRLSKLIRLLKKTCHGEFECKKAVFADLPLAKSRDCAMMCTACLVHQPFLHESELRFLLESVLLESEHKSA